MLVRVLNFLIGAVLAAGGGYLAWTERKDAALVFPPGPEGEPWLFILGLAAAITGLVFLATAVIPRPKRAARLAAAAAERKAKLGAAETYYGDPSRAAADRASADRDWRSGDLPPPPKPQPVPPPAPAAEPLLKPVTPPPAPPEPLLKPAPPQPAPAAPAPTPEPSVPAMAKPVAVKPVATSNPPNGQVVTPFPSTATLAPILQSADHTPSPAPAPPAPAAQIAALSPAPALAPAHAPTPPPAAPQPVDFSAIRAALAAGKLTEADKLLSAHRDTAQGEALAELTGLAGDHAAAAGRQSNAKWLWRLALKRFGECNAMNSPAARAVAERLRLSDN